MVRIFLFAGTLFAGLGVIAGAFGAHALRSRVTPERLETFEVAVRYQMYHALALLLVAWMMSRWPCWQVQAAGFLFAAGIVVFSGSLYLLVLSGTTWLGAVTPIGGLAFIAGWGLMAWTVLSSTLPLP